MSRSSAFAFVALSFLAGCTDIGTSCAFLDRGFGGASPVDHRDLPPSTIHDDTAIASARRKVEYCYNKRPSLRAEEIAPYETRRGRSGEIYLLYIPRYTSDTVVGFVVDAKGQPLYAVEGGSPRDFYNRAL
jgi:hypothetical protein